MIPQPPDHSCFQLAGPDADGPQLTWWPAYSIRRRLGSYPWHMLVFLACMFVFVSQICVLAWQEFGARLNARGGWGNMDVMELMRVILPTAMMFVVGAIFHVAVGVLVSRLYPRRWPERITFGRDALLYEVSGFFKRRRPRALARDEIGEIRCESVHEGPRVLLDHGVERLKIGANLSDSELEWLGEALRSWATEAPDAIAQPRIFPPLPIGSWIELEPTELGGWRLQWLPDSARVPRWLRFGCAGTLLCFILGALILEAPRVIQFAGGLPQFFGLPLPVALILLGVLAITISAIVAGHHALFRMARVICKEFRPAHRPESVTLSSSTLTYDPGYYMLGMNPDPGVVREMPWTQVTITLERTLTGQKLLVCQGEHRLEIGRCLREPEREWVAAVLRLWLAGHVTADPDGSDASGAKLESLPAEACREPATVRCES